MPEHTGADPKPGANPKPGADPKPGAAPDGRPHPASGPALLILRRAVRHALHAPHWGSPRTNRPYFRDPEQPLAVALSGGADSLALLAATVAETAPAGGAVAALVVDHGLQPGSAEIAARAVDAARALGVTDARVLRVDVGTAGGPEAAARTARYDALGEGARAVGAEAVLLGHTREDQAETVLLGIARGSGARSLAGMRAEHVREDGTRYLRPLLDVPRAVTHAACAELGLAPWQDPHNQDPAYTRVRVRSELLPVLDDVLGSGATAALARTADLLRDDADALDAWAEAAWAEARRSVDELGPESTAYSSLGSPNGVGVEVEAIVELPAAVRRRVLRLAAVAAGAPAGSLSAAHLSRVDDLVARWKGQGAVALPGPVEVGRACGRLTFRGR